jgi:large subunit ribosomal protein L29
MATIKKMTEIRGLEDGDLNLQIDKVRKELFDLRVKAATESIENPRAIEDLRRSVARLLTERRRRELAQENRS